MRVALERRGLSPTGVPNTHLYHLVGRDSANPGHPARTTFSLQFARPSPYALMEILNMTEPQRERFMQAYDIAKALLRELHVFPEPGKPEQEQIALEIDEQERGYRATRRCRARRTSCSPASRKRHDPATRIPRVMPCPGGRCTADSRR
jgi:hypothetical protein